MVQKKHDINCLYNREFPIIKKNPHTNKAKSVNFAKAIRNPEKFLSMFNERNNPYDRSK